MQRQQPTRYGNCGTPAITLLCLLSVCGLADSATCASGAPTCGSHQRALCSITSTQQHVWACAPAAAGPGQPCGGLRHGGSDAATTTCSKGYRCTKQDGYWWFCKPQQHTTLHKVPGTRPQPPNTAGVPQKRTAETEQQNRSSYPGGTGARPLYNSGPKLPGGPSLLATTTTLPSPARVPQSVKAQPLSPAKPINASTVPPGVVYRRYSSMLYGKVLVRDVASLSYDGATYQYGPQVHSAPSCEQECRRTAGCNAWAVCPPVYKYPPVPHPGCGSGCLEYSKTHRIWKGDDADLQQRYCSMLVCSATMVNISWPADFIGPFNGFGTGSCAWTCPGNKLCTSGPSCGFPTCARPGAPQRTDRWSLGTCTLLQVERPDQPTAVQGAAGAGWLSGTIQVPAVCTRLSARACETCQQHSRGSTPVLQRCVACLRAKNVTGAQELTFQDYVQVACRPKGSQKPYQPFAMDSSIRLSEYQCTGGYPKDAAQLTGAGQGQECVAQQLPLNLERD